MSDPTQNRPDADERQRAAQALELRTSGLTYAAIAAELKYSDESGPRKAVDRLLSRIECEGAEELRQLEGQRLDAMQRAIWPKACSGDMDAIRTALSIMGRRAKLLGLDAPTRVAVGTSPSDVEFANEAARLIERIAAHGELGEFVGGLRAQAVADAYGQTATAEGSDPGAQPDSLSEAYSGEVPDDLAGWSNIGDPAPAPADPAAPPAIASVPEPEPEPLPAPQPIQSAQSAAPPAWMRRNIGGNGYDPTSGWRP
ncbi:hypothetical protein [Mycobacterium sp. TY814]|uniref:hypothetical protein n=1 Tax=Mycobacterium sp. TY814 TaxID=3050580 RepID=UPI0027424B03|nr:hypothetical protein [Mycobacterium sp. TY814]MDP7720757.1 hypothetical protein [Mycobacterium sp. TY814]